LGSRNAETISGTPAINELAASSQGTTDTAPRYYNQHCSPRCDDVVAHGLRELAAFEQLARDRVKPDPDARLV
jgi:hypothetical protein